MVDDFSAEMRKALSGTEVSASIWTCTSKLTILKRRTTPGEIMGKMGSSSILNCSYSLSLLVVFGPFLFLSRLTCSLLIGGLYSVQKSEADDHEAGCSNMLDVHDA